MIDQCLSGLRLIRAAQRHHEKVPELCVFRAQPFGVRAVAIRLEQWQQVALFRGEMGFDAGKFGPELGLGTASKQMPAETQRGVMLTGQLSESLTRSAYEDGTAEASPFGTAWRPWQVD